MTEPTKEQIEVWHQEATGGTKTLDLPCFAKLAFAAGRKAGMEEAQWACKRLAVRHAGTQRGQGAQECIGEIDAAMEADK